MHPWCLPQCLPLSLLLCLPTCRCCIPASMLACLLSGSLPQSLLHRLSPCLFNETLTINIRSRISPIIFKKIWNAPPPPHQLNTEGPEGPLIHEKNLKSKILYQTPFKWLLLYIPLPWQLALCLPAFPHAFYCFACIPAPSQSPRKKKLLDIPVPSRDVTYQTLRGQE